MKSSHARLALAALSALAALLVLASTAGAATIQVPGGAPTASFGPDGTGATDFGAGKDPTSLAFNQAAHRLYALAAAGVADKIHAFDSPALTLAGGAFPLAVANGNSASDIAVDNTASPSPSAGNVYHVNAGGGVDSLLYGFNAAGAPLGGGFPISPMGPSFGGVAVDPAGSIYGTDGNTIKKYSPAGALLGQLSLPANKLTFDANGDLYAGNLNGVTKYTAASGFTAATQIDPNSTAALAVNRSTDQLYVVHSNKVSVWGTDGTQLNADFASGITGENLSGIAVDEANKVAYVADRGNGVIYAFAFKGLTVPTVTTAGVDRAATTATLHGSVNPGGLAVSDCHFEYTTEADYAVNGFAGSAHVDCGSNPGSGSAAVSVAAAIAGLSPGSDYRYRLVASNANAIGLTGTVKSFTTKGPQVSGETPSAIGATTATLNAQINPQGEGTSYHFQYVSQADFDQSGFANASLIPAGVAGVGSGNSDVAVSQTLSDLPPGTTYHFRAVATNSSATTVGKGSAFTTLAQDNTNCSNAEVRAQQDATYLPDCRAYEMVSPLEKAGFDIDRFPVFTRPDGDAVAFSSLGAFADPKVAAMFNTYGGFRDGGDWQTQALNAATNPAPELLTGKVMGTSGDLTKQLIATNAKLTPEAVEGALDVNLYIHDSTDDSYQFVATSHSHADAGAQPQGGFIFWARFSGASYDGSHFVFSTPISLGTTPDAPSGSGLPGEDKLYDFNTGTGQLSYVGVDDLGGVVPNSFAAGPSAGSPSFARPVSADGERIYWYSGTAFDIMTPRLPLYLSEGGQVTLVSESATLWGVSADGSYAYLTSSDRLTPDASPAGSDLYRYNAETDQYLDLTPGNIGASGADVQSVLGVSSDGSYAYFVAKGALAPGAGAGKSNLYAYHDGATRFLGTFTGEVPSGVPPGPNVDTDARISPSGRYLGFLTKGAIIGSHPKAASPFRKAYLYDYEADSLNCASCLPGDAAPSADVTLHGHLGIIFGTRSFKNSEVGQTRNVSDAGQFFFESKDALLGADINGKQDVYEYESGHTSLISSGQSDDDSNFGDATPDGRSVFLVTREKLVGHDIDPFLDLYVARVGGGSVEPAVQPPCEAAESCHGPATTPPENTGAGTGVFQGLEDQKATPPLRCPKGKHKVRRGGKTRCVNKPKPHKHHKRANHKRRAKR